MFGFMCGPYMGLSFVCTKRNSNAQQISAPKIQHQKYQKNIFLPFIYLHSKYHPENNHNTCFFSAGLMGRGLGGMTERAQNENLMEQKFAEQMDDEEDVEHENNARRM